MSYRLRIGRFPKNKHILYKNKSYVDILNQFSNGKPDDFLFSSLENFEELEFIPGLKYKDESEWIDFYSFNLNKETGNEFFILSKLNLKTIIDTISKNVSEYYNNLYDNLENPNSNKRVASMLLAKKNDWDTTYFKTLILDENNICSTHSESYEYIVFNLISIYKMFDWENDYLILSGW